MLWAITPSALLPPDSPEQTTRRSMRRPSGRNRVVVTENFSDFSTIAAQRLANGDPCTPVVFVRKARPPSRRRASPPPRPPPPPMVHPKPHPLPRPPLALSNYNLPLTELLGSQRNAQTRQSDSDTPRQTSEPTIDPASFDTHAGRPDFDALMFHPLMGDLDPALAWENLRLFETEVLPHLIAELTTSMGTTPSSRRRLSGLGRLLQGVPG